MLDQLDTIMKDLGLGYKFLFVLIVAFLGFLTSRLLRFFLSRYVKKSADKLNVDPTNYNFLKNAVSFLIFLTVLIIVFYSIPELSKMGMSLMASAGILAAIVGFASQQAFSNIVSGVFIVIFKPFHVGDYIRVGQLHYGSVEDITLRHTVIRNPENRRVIIPNSVISSETILNSSITDQKICTHVELGISYGSSIDKAIEIIRAEAMCHSNFVDNRSEEDIADEKHPVMVRVVNLGESSVNLRAYVWAEDPGKAFVLKCDLFKSIKEHFDREGVEIPFPQRAVHIRQEGR